MRHPVHSLSLVVLSWGRPQKPQARVREGDRSLGSRLRLAPSSWGYSCFTRAAAMMNTTDARASVNDQDMVLRRSSVVRKGEKGATAAHVPEVTCDNRGFSPLPVSTSWNATAHFVYAHVLPLRVFLVLTRVSLGSWHWHSGLWMKAPVCSPRRTHVLQPFLTPVAPKSNNPQLAIVLSPVFYALGATRTLLVVVIGLVHALVSALLGVIPVRSIV